MGVKTKDVHLIGHSLGAHISGYAGQSIKQLGRITGTHELLLCKKCFFNILFNFIQKSLILHI